MRFPIFCTSSIWPGDPARACCLDTNWEKDVCGLKLLRLRGLIVCCLFACRCLLIIITKILHRFVTKFQQCKSGKNYDNQLTVDEASDRSIG